MSGTSGAEEAEDESLLSDDASSESDGKEDGPGGAQPDPRPPPLHFAPPFYGRPPTPLPPSPSLTSLLRPSRPTTPDASDDDPHLAAEGPVPRASPTVPTYEYYGFVLYLFSSLAFLLYLLWSYLPAPLLHALGIYYYPNRWWSLAIPSFLVVGLVYIYAALAGYNAEILTLPMGSVETVVDEVANIAAVEVDERGCRTTTATGGKRKSGKPVGATAKGGGGGGGGGGGEVLDFREAWNEGTDAVMDIPLAGVCEVLYGEWGDVDGVADQPVP
jgi:hypothetical protein